MRDYLLRPIRSWLAPPIIGDAEERIRLAAIINSLILSAVALLLGLLILQVGLGVANSRNVPVALSMCFLLMVTREIARFGRLSLAVILFCSIFLMGFSLIAYNNGTVRAMGTAAMMICVIVPTLLIGPRTGFTFLILTSAFVLGLALAEIAGTLPPLRAPSLTPLSQWLIFTCIILFHWVLVSTARNSMVEALRRAREENRLRKSAEENLHDLNAALEQRVVERTAELQREILRREQAETKYQTLVEHIPAVTYVTALDDARTRLYTSPQIESLVGYTSSAYLADPDLWSKVLHPDDRARVLAESTRFYETGEPFISDYRAVTRDGRILWLHDEAVIYTDETNQHGYVQGVALDITARKQAEEALRASEQKFASIFAKAPLSIALAKLPDGVFVDVNEAFERDFGYTKHEVLGRTSLELGINPDAEIRKRVLAILQERGSASAVEYLFHTKSGKTGTFIVNTELVDIGDQKYILTMANNITERKQAEQDRIRAEAELQVALKRTAVLYDVTKTGMSAGSLTAVLQELAQLVARGLTADRVALIIMDFQARKIKNFVRGGPGADQIARSVSYDELMEGLSGWVIRTGQSALSPKNAPDARESEGVRKRRIATNCGSILVTPLQYQDQKLGTLTVINRPEEPDFTDSDVEFLEAIASQISSAIVKVTLEENLHRRNERLAFLHQITLNLLKQENMEDLTQTVTDEASQLLSADGGYLALVEDDRLVDRAISPRHLPYQKVTSRLEDDQTIVRQVIDSRETMVVRDFSSLPNISPQAAALGVKAAVLWPLLTTEKCRGVLGVGRTSSEEPFNEEDIFLGSLFTRVAGLVLDNTRLREALRQEAIRDPLTGLFNRRFMQEELTVELRRAERHAFSLAVVMLDLDHFKRINDTFGHEAGDQALRQTSSLLRSRFRGSDIACRYGGEEFTLILPEASLTDTIARMEELRGAVKRMAVLHQGIYLSQLTVSIGIAIYPKHGSSGEALLKAADEALYQAKRAGRDQVVSA